MSTQVTRIGNSAFAGIHPIMHPSCYDLIRDLLRVQYVVDSDHTHLCVEYRRSGIPRYSSFSKNFLFVSLIDVIATLSDSSGLSKVVIPTSVSNIDNNVFRGIHRIVIIVFILFP